jgi:hypothetical protein
MEFIPLWNGLSDNNLRFDLFPRCDEACKGNVTARIDIDTARSEIAATANLRGESNSTRLREMPMDEQIVQDIFAELFSALEPLETQSAALLQWVKAKGIASDEELAPFLVQAANASNVRWRAMRVRTAALISSAMKPEELESKTTDTKAEQKAKPEVLANKASDQNQKSDQTQDKGKEKSQESEPKAESEKISKDSNADAPQARTEKKEDKTQSSENNDKEAAAPTGQENKSKTAA